MAFCRIASSQLFWPPDRPHRVAFTELTPHNVSLVVRAQLRDLCELAELADTIRSFEGVNGAIVTDAAETAARERSAALLLRIAEGLPGPESEVVASRAAGLACGDSLGAARRQAEVEERDLVLLCGPVSTWRRKSTATFHGMMASVPVASWNAFVARADSLLGRLVPYLAGTLEQPALTTRPVPGFRIADLFVCGGEPNGFPKHFAYFLPEDEGVRGASCAKTLVYANVYAAHHELISRPLAALTLDPPESAWPDRTLEPLLLWFRGHDVGHQLRLPQTALRELHVVGPEASIALQEALADVIGYLATAGGPWQSELGLERAAAGSVFLAELLRYVQRGPRLFPDSDAAFLELSYLSDGGYVELDASRGRLAWEPDALHHGMVALGRELTQALLDTDVARTRALIAAHLPVEGEGLAGWWTEFDAATSDVPTTFAYCAPELSRSSTWILAQEGVR
jgi:hypothetical protein